MRTTRRLLAAALGAALLARAAVAADPGPAPAPARQQAAGTQDLTAAVEAIRPSLVTVITTITQEGRDLPSVSTGIIATSDGHILTASSTVAAGTSYHVRLHDATLHPAALHATDAVTGLAMLKIAQPPAGLVPARLADSSALRVGQWVIAAGNQFGIETDTLPGYSVGIIGGLNVSVPFNEGRHHNLIRTDAPTNAGCVGGPLVDALGRVVAINTAICSSTGTWQGVGYAIPSNDVAAALPKLIAGTTTRRGWLGLQIASEKPLVIGSVLPDTPADKAGLRQGDTLLAFDNAPIDTALQLIDIVAATPPGTTVTLAIERDGAAQNIPVTIAPRPADIGNHYPPANNNPPDHPAPPTGDGEPRSALPDDIRRELEDAARNFSTVLQKSCDRLRDPATLDQVKHLCETIPGVQLRIQTSPGPDDLTQENLHLRQRIAELEAQLKHQQPAPGQ